MAKLYEMDIKAQITHAVENSDESGNVDDRHLMHITWAYMRLTPNQRTAVFVDTQTQMLTCLQIDHDPRRTTAFMHIRDMFDLVRDVRTLPRIRPIGRKR